MWNAKPEIRGRIVNERMFWWFWSGLALGWLVTVLVCWLTARTRRVTK